MTITLFLTLLILLAAATSLLTQAVKTYLDSKEKQYSSNAVVLILSVIVGAGGTAIFYLFLAIPFTVNNIICIPLMAICVWVGAMIGYDKVIQMIEQFRGLKR